MKHFPGNTEIQLPVRHKSERYGSRPAPQAPDGYGCTGHFFGKDEVGGMKEKLLIIEPRLDANAHE